MRIHQLIGHLAALSAKHGDLDVHLYADQEGLTTMEPASVTVHTTHEGKPVALISAWEPDGNEPL